MFPEFGCRRHDQLREIPQRSSPLSILGWMGYESSVVKCPCPAQQVSATELGGRRQIVLSTDRGVVDRKSKVAASTLDDLEYFAIPRPCVCQACRRVFDLGDCLPYKICKSARFSQVFQRGKSQRPLRTGTRNTLPSAPEPGFCDVFWGHGLGVDHGFWARVILGRSWAL